MARASRVDVLDDFRTGAGQADVGGVDAERVHVAEDVDLLIDRRHAHRRRLQAVAQRLVVQHRDRRTRAGRVVVPVVDQRMGRYAHRRRSSSATSRCRRRTAASRTPNQPRIRIAAAAADAIHSRGGDGRAHPVVDARVGAAGLRGQRRSAQDTAGRPPRSPDRRPRSRRRRPTPSTASPRSARRASAAAAPPGVKTAWPSPSVDYRIDAQLAGSQLQRRASAQRLTRTRVRSDRDAGHGDRDASRPSRRGVSRRPSARRRAPPSAAAPAR